MRIITAISKRDWNLGLVLIVTITLIVSFLQYGVVCPCLYHFTFLQKLFKFPNKWVCSVNNLLKSQLFNSCLLLLISKRSDAFLLGVNIKVFLGGIPKMFYRLTFGFTLYAFLYLLKNKCQLNMHSFLERNTDPSQGY